MKLDVFKVSLYGVQMTVKSVTSLYSISEQKSYAEFIVWELVFKTKIWKITFQRCLKILLTISLEW